MKCKSNEEIRIAYVCTLMQISHTDEPPVDDQPDGHTEHAVDAPAVEYRPAGQGRHPKAPSEKVPAGHASQQLAMARDQAPAGQGVQDEAPRAE